MFEDDICVDLSNVLDGKPNYANIPLSELFAKPCVDRPEVLDGGPDYAVALLAEFFLGLGAPCLGAPRSCSGQGVWMRGGESSSKMFRLFFFFHFFLSCFFLFSFGD